MDAVQCVYCPVKNLHSRRLEHVASKITQQEALIFTIAKCSVDKVHSEKDNGRDEGSSGRSQSKSCDGDGSRRLSLSVADEPLVVPRQRQHRHFSI